MGRLRILREIHGVEYEFELTRDEMWEAKEMVEDMCLEQEIRDRMGQLLEEALPDMVESFKDWKHYGGAYASDEDAIDSIIRAHLE